MPDPNPIACSLDQEELTDRGRLLAALGQVMTAIEASGRGAELSFPASHRDDLESFIRAESSCCPFFEFSLVEAGNDLKLSIGAPAGGEGAVRGLVAGFVAGWSGFALPLAEK